MTQDIIRQPSRRQIELPASPSQRVNLIVIIGACLLFAGCTSPAKQKVVEAPPQSSSPAPAETAQPEPQQAQTLPAPDLPKVQEAVRRVFKDAALIDTTRKPSFIAGDFNGDLSQDIAVILKPAAGKLSEINEQFPRWIIKDPFTPNGPGLPRLRITEDEALLAVIHGYGPSGWHDPQATQTYLLKNAAGSEMKTRPGKEFVAANRGKNLPPVKGDLIGEVLKGASGYLYYGSATYSWYDSKTFKGETQQGAFHTGGRGRMK